MHHSTTKPTTEDYTHWLNGFVIGDGRRVDLLASPTVHMNLYKIFCDTVMAARKEERSKPE